MAMIWQCGRRYCVSTVARWSSKGSMTPKEINAKNKYKFFKEQLIRGKDFHCSGWRFFFFGETQNVLGETQQVRQEDMLGIRER